MRKLFVCISFALVTSALAWAGQQGRQLSPQDTDRAIDNVFNGAAGVVRSLPDPAPDGQAKRKQRQAEQPQRKQQQRTEAPR